MKIKFIAIDTETGKYDDNSVTSTVTIEGEVLTHTDITDKYVDFLRSCGYVLNELSTTRFD